jgi:UDP-glucose 4-epimerase
VTWLVTGGAGYIGAHIVRALRAAGMEVSVIDDLSSGHRRFVPVGVPFVEASILDRAALDVALASGVSGVVHAAAFKYAGVSVTRPLHTYEQNVTATAALLAAMVDHGVHRMVFASSAAVYGTPDSETVTEATRVAPQSPYGETKLIGEWLLRDEAVAANLSYTALRYFNVVGSATPAIYDTSAHNLVPIVLTALAAGRPPQVFGTDYPTPDGTCIRDYVHVEDVALAHVQAAQHLEEGRPLLTTYNLGSGIGTSVAEIMAVAAEVTGVRLTPERLPRRPGDPARIVASGEQASRDLGWANRHTLHEMIAGAWEAMTR